MSKEKDNLELWNRVKATDTKYTKTVNQRGGYTAISPQYQLQEATREFGQYGATWGLKDIAYDYGLVELCRLAVMHATFFYPGGEFSISNSIEVVSAKGYPDSDFAKKIETNTISKALSKLGFSADVFMGEFDDVEYLAMRQAESQIEHAENKAEEKAKKIAEFKAEIDKLTQQMREAKTMGMLNGLRTSIIRKAELRGANNIIKRTEEVYNEMRDKIEGEKND